MAINNIDKLTPAVASNDMSPNKKLKYIIAMFKPIAINMMSLNNKFKFIVPPTILI